MNTANNTIRVIQHLRSDVYPNEDFKDNFSHQLSKKIYAENVEYVPEQFGGWNVNVVINKNKIAKIGKESTSASFYYDILNCLISSIKSCENISYSQNIPELANVIISGSDSLVIKI